MNHELPTQTARGGRHALFAGGLAALLASTCCIGPLVLITLGISGAWISHLTLLEPYQPFFIGAAVIALFFAYRKIWRPMAECEPGHVCAIPSVKRSYKALFWIVVALVILSLGFPFVAPLLC